MQCGFQKLVCNLCYYKEPTAPLVSAAAAVIAKPQPKRGSVQTVSPPTLWLLSAAKFQCILLYLISTFFKSMMAVYLGSLIPFIPIYSQFLPFSIFALHFPPTSPLVSPAHSLSPLCVFTHTALPTIRTRYCQLCHLRLPERWKKWMGQHHANRAGVGVYL